MNKYEITYRGRELPGLVERSVNDVQILVQEAEVAEWFEKMFSNLVDFYCNYCNGDSFYDEGRSKLSLNRFNARQEHGPYAFYIHFTPTVKEREALHYDSTTLALGNLADKTIDFACGKSKVPDYVTHDFIPMLRKLFEAMDFQVLPEN